MTRLTKKYPSGAWGIDGSIDEAVLKLAAYEDSGLCPERVMEFAKADAEGRYIVMKDAEQDGVARLRELAQADKDGRIVVLPAKISDTVYHITTCKNFARVYDGTLYDADGGHGTATGLYCPCELAENCPHPLDDDGSFDCDKHKNALAIFEDVVTGIYIDDVEDSVMFEYSGGAYFEDFGRTVFLTREAAEEALKTKAQNAGDTPDYWMPLPCPPEEGHHEY